MKFDNIYQQIWEKVDLKGMKPKNFNAKTLKKGQKVEKEHSDNPKVAQKIAQQHMVEYPKQDKNKKIDSDYYEELENTETKLKKTLTKSFDSMVKDIKKSVSESQTLLENLGDDAWFIINGKPINADDWHEKYVVNYLKKTKKEAGIPLTDEEQKIVYGLVDPVPYALKLGWIRVRILGSGIAIEMQTLTSDTLKQLVDGIWEILPDINDNQLFLIDVKSPKETTYVGVPFEVLQSGEIDNLNYYNSHRQWAGSDTNESYDIHLETSMAGTGGVFGDSPEIGNHGGQVGNQDWYAPGDARNVWGTGGKKSTKSKKCKSCQKKTMLMPIARRTIK